jgi:DNA-binding XRE family transcriptional regulator
VGVIIEDNSLSLVVSHTAAENHTASSGICSRYQDALGGRARRRQSVLVDGVPSGEAKMESKKPIDPAIGRRLRELREHQVMTQEQLANAIGISHQLIALYELGRVAIPSRVAAELSHGLGCRISELYRQPGARLPGYRRRLARSGGQGAERIIPG